MEHKLIKQNKMNARQANEVNNEMIITLLDSAKDTATRRGITVNEAIDLKVRAYSKGATPTTAAAWEIRGEKAKVLAN